MRNGPGQGGRDFGSIDWSNIDLSGFGRRRGAGGPSRRGTVIGILIAAVFLLPLLVSPLVSFLTDLLWFRSLGLESVYLLRFTASFWAFLGFFLVFFGFAIPNLYAALRPAVPRLVVEVGVPRPRGGGALGLTLRLLPVLLVPSFFFGLVGADSWDDILRFIATIKLKETTASDIFRRLNSYSKQHGLYQGLKAFGQIPKSLFILRYIDEPELRMSIEKVLNGIEHVHRFTRAVSVGSPREFLNAEKEDQKLAEACKRLIKNCIVKTSAQLLHPGLVMGDN